MKRRDADPIVLAVVRQVENDTREMLIEAAARQGLDTNDVRQALALQRAEKMDRDDAADLVEGVW